ncbi:dTDP-4-dehydrorhamnose 3,5-epimerase family protein [Rubrimonas cliftonensis]|uniref:dTDP-4-dehydrorhamnose 3,5-epimerase n=1 Tax=Rubrimonas cliftonensis TaxID=89524 RepID=A0A1H4G6N9_9RHOB|nr:dTDP-4-dehydrorhamnose 3,5-epimerase [Rubrimonas cliftonensis]SEB05303.1 dTDP-4-dehydrorhamnose 3,5-epimerase [Rubrimonas cliftonensis]
MRVSRAAMPEVAIIETDAVQDERGAFARLVCVEALAAAGLPFRPVQISRSCNRRAGTLRGMHLQRAPHGETKLVQALRGRAFDVALDLRPGPGFGRWCAVELRPGRAVMIPKGFAHGFLTLEDETELLYATDHPWTPGAEAGVRWDDPAFAIGWPEPPRALSPRDAAHPLRDGSAAPAA